MDMQVCTDALRAEVGVFGRPGLTRLPGRLRGLGRHERGQELQRVV